MKILNRTFVCLETSHNIAVPDCSVSADNKIGRGHGEQKLYFGTRESLETFLENKQTAKCFFLKSDLEAYMLDIKQEYDRPTQPYAGVDRLSTLWKERNAFVAGLDEMIWFTVSYQHHLNGPRGYLNSKDENYNIFRELGLPNTSYIMIMKLSGMGTEPVYYWKFFVDYKAIYALRKTPLVYSYGKQKSWSDIQSGAIKESETLDEAAMVDIVKKNDKKSKREAQKQKKYRDALFKELPFCPITGITEERLLLASHIKPFECCETEREGFDPLNGFLLSPLYDKLFDRGFISFTDDRRMMVSNWLSPFNQKLCRVKDNAFYQKLPIVEGRLRYLKYHREHVFKG